jgi:hypothetical protein
VQRLKQAATLLEETPKFNKVFGYIIEWSDSIFEDIAKKQEFNFPVPVIDPENRTSSGSKQQPVSQKLEISSEVGLEELEASSGEDEDYALQAGEDDEEDAEEDEEEEEGEDGKDPIAPGMSFF